jgi:hypothetical protein
MKFINNPFNTLLEIMEENYPNAECDIYIGESMTDGIETFGCTLFPEEIGYNWTVVEIHHSLSLTDAVEILAHELAHVVAGVDAEHNEEWESVFDHIHKEFQRKLDEQFSS